MNKSFLLALFVGVFFISMVCASLDSLGTFQQNTCVNISQTCASCTYVNISSVTNRTSTIISNIEMTDFGNGEWRYEFCNTSNSGRYDVRGMGDVNGVDSSFATYFLVTPSGVEANESRTAATTRSIYFLFTIAVLLFIAFLFVNAKPPIKWTFFLVSMMFFLQAVNILFVGLQDEVVNPKIEGYFSFLTASSFILFWFAFGLIFIIWFLTFFQTMLLKKNKIKTEKFG